MQENYRAVIAEFNEQPKWFRISVYVLLSGVLTQLLQDLGDGVLAWQDYAKLFVHAALNVVLYLQTKEKESGE